MVELLISIGIVGLLLALLLPALQKSRETSRRWECSSRIRQMSLALLNHEASRQVFPRGGVMSTDGTGGHVIRAHAPHVYLLPYLDAANVYRQIDLLVASERYLVSSRLPSDPNYGVRQVRLQCFLCPSDPNVLGLARNSYRANIGITAAPTWIPTPGKEGAFSPPQYALTPADFPDGLSNTSVFSERLTGSGDRGDVYSPAVDMWGAQSISGTMNFGPMSQAEIDAWFDNACGSLYAANPPHNSDLGAYWFYAGLLDTWYNHGLLPNSFVPDCGIPHGRMTIGLVAARSRHYGGVNVAFADAHVQFVSNEIHRNVWRGWSTRNGAEVVSTE